MEGLSDAVRLVFIALLGMSAAAHLAVPLVFRLVYRRPESPTAFVPVFAVPRGFAAFFLALPHTHIWGCAIVATILFMSVVTMLKNGRYAFALLGIAVMTALPFAILADPLA